MQARLKLWRIVAKRHPSAFLLAAQLLSLMLYPLMDQTSEGRMPAIDNIDVAAIAMPYRPPSAKAA